MSILAWRDALAVKCIGDCFGDFFTSRDAGWPNVMTPWQIASMQRPYVFGDMEGSRFSGSLHDAIFMACECGDLLGAAEIFPAGDRGSEWGYLPEYSQKTKAYILYRITAQALSSWLATNGQAPSVHIKAWFKSQGVALDTESSSAPETPAIKKGDVTDWPSLVQYRQQFFELAAQNRPSWPVEHIAILGAALKAEKASHSKGATKRVASELGISGQRVTELLEREDYKDWVERSAVPAIQATANVFAGLGDKSA